MSNDWRTIELDRGDHGVRVDRVLLRHLREEQGASRNRIQKWIDAGDVLITAPLHRAPPGGSRRATSCGSGCRTGATRTAARRIDRFEVLYEDDDLLAVNKPAGLVVHPSYQYHAAR